MEAISDDGSPTLESRYFVQIQTVVQTIETFFFTGIITPKAIGHLDLFDFGVD